MLDQALPAVLLDLDPEELRDGLVTAAGGGLSARDLAELTGIEAYDIEETLRTVAGRSFASRTGFWQPGAVPPVYMLGHEELQVAAAAALGPGRLERCRERLHDWAQDYRVRGWPAGTPEYLLRGYFRLLLEAADLLRLADCAADQVRYDRMLDITGGDAAALAEITDVQDLMLRLGAYDLPVLARLNVHRTRLADRNANIPIGLPAVWAAASLVRQRLGSCPSARWPRPLLRSEPDRRFKGELPCSTDEFRLGT